MFQAKYWTSLQIPTCSRLSSCPYNGLNKNCIFGGEEKESCVKYCAFDKSLCMFMYPVNIYCDPIYYYVVGPKRMEEILKWHYCVNCLAAHTRTPAMMDFLDPQVATDRYMFRWNCAPHFWYSFA